MLNAYLENTLVYEPELCNGCGVCADACQLNCITGAIHVESGVGCASAMIQAALKGQKEVECSCG
jgi:MinD superfamily P-loop ATPase